MTGPMYLKEHGITSETIKDFNLTWDDNYLNIPIKDENGEVIWTKHRNLKHNPKDPKTDSKYKNDTGSHATLFNFHAVRDKPNIVLCEGEIDCMRLIQEGIPSVSSTGGCEKFNDGWVELLKDKKLWICYDTDSAGKEGTRKLLGLFPEAKAITLPVKDVCEYFATGVTRKEFVGLVNTAQTKQEWLTTNVPEDYATLTVRELYKIEYPPENFIIEKFLPVNGITMFSGDSGAGKSFVALEIARAVTKDEPFLDHFRVGVPHTPVLIIDKENGLKRLQTRMRGMGIPETDDIYLLKYSERFNLQDPKFMQAVQDFIQVKKVGIVILDSFIDVLVGNENAAPDVSLVFNALRSISTEVCWVLLHHESKPMPRFKRTVSDRARGSSNIKAQLDYLFSLQKTKDLKVIHIEQGKARDYEAIPMFAVEFMTGDTGEMSGFKYLGEVKDDSSAVDEAATFIVDYLTGESGKCRQEIVEAGDALGIASSAVVRALKMLQEKKIVGSKNDPIKKSRKLFYILNNSDNEDENGTDEGSMF